MKHLFACALLLSACSPDEVSPTVDFAEPSEAVEEITEPVPVFGKADHAQTWGPSEAGICGMRASLGSAGLDPLNRVEFEGARIQETLSSSGALFNRVLRRFNAEGSTVWVRDEIVEQGCLILATVSVFDDQGNQTKHSIEVGDPQAAQMLSPYEPAPVNTVETWRYDVDGLPMEHRIDWGNDGSVEQVELFTYDAQGRLVQTTCDRGGDMQRGCNTTEQTWQYDPQGRIIEETETSFGTTRVTSRRFDGELLLFERRISGDELTFEAIYRYDDEGRLLRHTQTASAHVTDRVLTYENGVLAQEDMREDFTGDGRIDRHEVNRFDALGNRILHEQDQPMDGVFDWREVYTFKGMLKTSVRVTNLNTGEIVRTGHWIYDDEGRITEADSGYGTTVHVFDAAGHEVRTRAFTREGVLRSQTVQRYGEDGQRLLRAIDGDGDGGIDSVVAWHFDLAGNLIAELNDNDGDFYADQGTLYLYR